MTPSSPDMSLQQRILNHIGVLSHGLRLLARLPADTVLVPGYSDGHTTISQVTLEQVEAMLTHSMNQLEAEAQHLQQPEVGVDGAATTSPGESATT